MFCNVLQTQAVSSSRRAFSTGLGGAYEVQTFSFSPDLTDRRHRAACFVTDSKPLWDVSVPRAGVSDCTPQ